jgi:hypothetical protein
VFANLQLFMHDRKRACALPQSSEPLERQKWTLQFTRRGSGKLVRIVDRIAGREVLNEFLDPEEKRPVSVTSNDGQSGDIDVYKRMTAQNPEYIDREDYHVVLNETVEVDDV